MVETKRTRDHSDIRREQLIQATIQTIFEKGISGTTLSNVASKAGLSPGIVNFYFNSKKQLLIDTLWFLNDEYARIVNEILARPLPPLEKLHAYIEICFDPRICAKEKVAVWHAFSGESQAREEYREVCHIDDEAEIEGIHKCISELMADPSKDFEDIAALVDAFMGMIDWLWQDALYDDGEFNRRLAIDNCKRFLKFLSPASKLQPTKVVDLNETVDLLPPWTYRNEEFLEMEIETLFRPSWMLVGHESDIPQIGDYLTFEGFNERAFVIRGKNGAINAFHNICRHRGSQLLQGEGRCPRALICPFHGWRYDLDGKLMFIPGKDGFPFIDQNSHGLVRLDLEIWKGFIFIRFVSGGLSVEESMLPIEDEIKHYQIENVQPTSEATEVIYPINWKVYHDIDNEGYHVPMGHPTLHQLYGQDYVDTSVENIPVSYGRFNSNIGNLWSVRHYRNLMPDLPHLPENRKDLWMYFTIVPNVVFGMYPDSMEVYMSIPLDLNNTIVRSRTYALPDERKEMQAVRYLNRRINNTTEAEDMFYMNTIQQGLNSTVFPRWNLSEIAETGVGDFHRFIQEQLPVAKLANQPKAGNVRQSNEALITS